MRKWGHVLVVGAILALAAWYSLRDLTFFTSDTGLRYLQVRVFQELGWRQAAMPYEGLRFDPGLRFVPYYYAYSPYGDKLLLAISPFFPLAVAGMIDLFGRAGIVVMPVLGTLVAAVSVGGLWRMAGGRGESWLIWGTALATPLLFYSMTLWDHTVAVGLTTAAVYLAARGLTEQRLEWLVPAGFVVALAIAQRAEAAPLAAALAAALFLNSHYDWRTIFFYGAGGLLGLLATVPFNLLWVGHPLGIVIARSYLGYGEAAYYPILPYEGLVLTRAVTTTLMLLNVTGGEMMTLVSALLLTFGSISLALVLRLPAWRRRVLLYTCLALIIAGTLLGLLQAPNRPIYGLFSTFPLFGLALAYVDDQEPGSRVYRLVFFTAWLFVGLTLVVLRSYGGRQWGARYLLPAVPLLLFLAVYTVRAFVRHMSPSDARAFRRIALVLVILSLLVQAAGARLLLTAKAFQLRDGISAVPAEIILTNDPFIASFMSSVEDKIFFYVEDEADIALLVERMGVGGVERITLVLAEGLPLTIPERTRNVRLEPEGPLLYRLELIEES